jgi:hypothetical protein
MASEFEKASFHNPIDRDKVTETPGLLPYPHHVGSPAFAPTRAGSIQSAALKAMEEQCDAQMQQIKEQIDLLAKQAQRIKDRMELSRIIFGAQMGFKPVIGSVYHLYARAESEFVLSMIGPDEWGKKRPFKYFVSSVKLLSDHTWEQVNKHP